MRMMMPRVWMVGLVLAWVGCTEAHVGSDDASPRDAALTPDTSLERDAGAEDGGTAVDAPEAILDAPSDAPVPSFDVIYESILVPRCGRCHIDEGTETGYYRPRLPDVDTAYAALRDVPVETPWVRSCIGEGVTAYRARPYDLETSMLAFLADCYVRDAEHDGLSADELAQIEAWISAGAPRMSF